MTDLDEIISRLITFRDARNWSQFHNSKDLALAISIEAAELNELFLWKAGEESEEVDKAKIGEELADIFAYDVKASRNIEGYIHFRDWGINGLGQYFPAAHIRYFNAGIPVVLPQVHRNLIVGRIGIYGKV